MRFSSCFHPSIPATEHCHSAGINNSPPSIYAVIFPSKLEDIRRQHIAGRSRYKAVSFGGFPSSIWHREGKSFVTKHCKKLEVGGSQIFGGVLAPDGSRFPPPKHPQTATNEDIKSRQPSLSLPPFQPSSMRSSMVLRTASKSQFPAQFLVERSASRTASKPRFPPQFLGQRAASRPRFQTPKHLQTTPQFGLLKQLSSRFPVSFQHQKALAFRRHSRSKQQLQSLDFRRQTPPIQARNNGFKPSIFGMLSAPEGSRFPSALEPETTDQSLAFNCHSTPKRWLQGRLQGSVSAANPALKIGFKEGFMDGFKAPSLLPIQPQRTIDFRCLFIITRP
ncbi:hypothetical protein BJ508DRAFT_310199 [Ascobolus immersus RN42]|uniref:Uncharacterized protein n=1 Tax=Ascobolus immersus RN42 TaxID=1160509 RepID=A0A3N4HWA4_ASCIM|nr:hypothetical protein BJ508DRAFT_310199 [Ascobolus immersus RN42]